MFADEKLEVVRPETVRAFDEFDRPEPRRVLNDWPPMLRLVVEAVVKEE